MTTSAFPSPQPPQGSAGGASAPGGKKPRGLILGLVVVGVVVLVIAGVLAWSVISGAIARQSAEARYADAVGAQNEAVESYDAASAAFDAAAADAEPLLEAADVMVEESSSAYLDADAVSEVDGAISEMSGLQETETPDIGEVVAVDAQQFESTEEYERAAGELEGEQAEIEQAATVFADLASGYDEAVPALERAVSDVQGTMVDSAVRIEEANISAMAPRRISLQYSAEVARDADLGDLAWSVGSFVESAQAVERSQADELAEKDQGDGLAETRLEIEEFVRSLIGDVRIDFDWAPIVNGLGQGESAGGYTTWWYGEGGYSTMELSNSIAAYWPDERFQGLVVHEAGHAITSQCRDMLDETFDGDVELMATAWAIGMGYDNPWGNGVDYYYDGVPPEQRYVDASKDCR
ncbi:hypothetical protein [Microbacterium sp. G2-8]|uniref:hypothetical protein n=1 Tax=Microbacterium sp. G2-8 TaxID=2842454 RepID=UPI001C8A4BD2|nr:hypothetical protein [Microbacterium sp. G2-8]